MQLRGITLVLVASFLLGVVSCKGELSERYVDATYLNCVFSIQLQSVPLKPKNSPLPHPTKQALPDYPIEMRLKGASGVVNFRLKISADGVVDTITVLHATNPMFEAATKEAIRGWKFLPTLENDKPVELERDYAVEFRIVIPD